MPAAGVVTEVPVSPVPLAALVDVADLDQSEQLAAVARDTEHRLRGRTIWNINSTASGGGVAEMLRPLIAYGRGAGLDVRWLVLGGDPTFFRVTKRLHHLLHGEDGDGGPLGPDEREHYDAVTRANFDELSALVRPGDICLCHDPQTAGLVPLLVERGLLVVWRSHIGTEHSNDQTERAWRFIGDDVSVAHRFVFSRRQYVPPFLGRDVWIICPSIDPFSTKNRDLAPDQVTGILGHVGILRPTADGNTTYSRYDGSTARVDHVADIVRGGAPPPPDAPLLTQVSRWDPLKDMTGVMQAFAADIPCGGEAHLVLAGPNVTGVADDPEGADVLTACVDAWRQLPHAARSRIALVCLPMADADENAVIVNALQRHATVVAQKSIHEGFGLTVAEAMWKGRPVVGSAVGGIQDQIIDGETGRLVDPLDLAGFGAAVGELLADRARADQLGAAGRERVRREFLASRHLIQYAALLAELVETAAEP